MKYSIIIGYYDPEYRKTEAFTRCLESVVRCSPAGSYELVIVKDGPSYCESYNRGMAAAKGDYLAVINDDIVLDESYAWLEDLEFDEGISSHHVGSGHDACEFAGVPIALPDASCFSLSRALYNKLGGFDEVYKDGINYEDTDYFLRARELGIPFYQAPVDLTHIGTLTAKTYLEEEVWRTKVAHNKAIFDAKWLKI